MMALEDASEGSRHVRPVNAFDKAAKAYRYFRDAECRRINTSYGSGNGGGLAELNCLIEMNIKRATQLNHTNQSK